LRRPAAKFGGIAERIGDTDRGNFYALDPNFEGFARSGAGILSGEFRYADDAGLNHEVRHKIEGEYFDWDGNPEAEADYVYVPENTMTAEDQRTNLVTHVVLRAQLALNDGSEPQHFFMSYTRDVTGNSTDYLPGWAAANYINTGRFNYGVLDQSTRKSDFAYMLDIAVAEHGFTGDMEQWDDIEPFTIDYPQAITKMVFYKHGVGYYSIPVRHFDVEGQGYYGVVRNNTYNIRIRNVHYPDSNVPPGPEYDNPLAWPGYDMNETGMEVVVSVNDWRDEEAVQKSFDPKPFP
jgi:hypothetical protein